MQKGKKGEDSKIRNYKKLEQKIKGAGGNN
jgi:hypothetical protein